MHRVSCTCSISFVGGRPDPCGMLQTGGPTNNASRPPCFPLPYQFATTIKNKTSEGNLFLIASALLGAASKTVTWKLRLLLKAHSARPATRTPRPCSRTGWTGADGYFFSPLLSSSCTFYPDEQTFVLISPVQMNSGCVLNYSACGGRPSCPLFLFFFRFNKQSRGRLGVQRIA